MLLLLLMFVMPTLFYASVRHVAHQLQQQIGSPLLWLHIWLCMVPRPPQAAAPSTSQGPCRWHARLLEVTVNSHVRKRREHTEVLYRQYLSIPLATHMFCVCYGTVLFVMCHEHACSGREACCCCRGDCESPWLQYLGPGLIKLPLFLLQLCTP